MFNRKQIVESGGHGPDPVLGMLRTEPFTLSEPSNRTTPLVFASPHSGRLYPSTFVRESRLSALNLRRSEDAFVDELFAGALEIGAPLIIARFPRAFLDLNRSPAELDAAMFEGPLSIAVDAVSPRVSAGLGVIPRIVRDGAEIYLGKLAAEEAEDRLACFYRPYHAALTRLIDDARAQYAVAVLIDCHSMPAAAAAPDIILGDRYGLSAAPIVTRIAERAFETQGFRVARNIPYAGGFTTQLHGRPARGVHALQIEVNRGLYMDEERILRTASFPEVASRVAAALKDLAQIGDALGSLAGLAHAAE
jgi:N-formylglutamate amidohydrolase